jgi:hypothetical protein
MVKLDTSDARLTLPINPKKPEIRSASQHFGVLPQGDIRPTQIPTGSAIKPDWNPAASRSPAL